MDGKIKIAITGLSTLESYALKSLIHEEHAASVCILSDQQDIVNASEMVSLIIVSDSCFVANLSFFMPRIAKTIIVTNEIPGDMTNLLSVRFLCNRSDISEIKGTIYSAIKGLSKETPVGQLSQRETEVLRLIAMGKLNKEIADILCISINTVITHRKNISTKLGIKSASGLGRFAMMNGLV